MMTWLRKSPTSTRRAARAAAPVVRAKPQAAAEVDDEMPPPFFADGDPAFLDMGDGEEERRSELLAEAPVCEVAPVVETASVKRGKVAQALLALPTFPERDQPDRMRQLLAIYRSLDRIAADAVRSEV